MTKKLENLNDITKLILTIKAGDDKNISITTENISPYIFLLKQNGIEFNYNFNFNPLPYSDELRDDIDGLNFAKYLSVGSPIHITERGKRWLSNYDDKLNDIEKTISLYLVDFSKLNEKLLFDKIYSMICR